MDINAFFDNYNLGKVNNVSSISGGLVHKMYKVITDSDIYAVKEINKLKDNVTNFNNSEVISNYVNDHGIDTSYAIKINNSYINEFNNHYYIVYKYIAGHILDDNEITIEHCKRIGSIVSKLHNINIDNLDINKDKVLYTNKYDFNSYVENNNFINMKYKDIYLDNYKSYNDLLDKCIFCYNNTYDQLSLCHKDLKPSNVMWVNNDAILIDFETAGVWNKTREIVGVSIDWSGFLSNKFDKNKFKIILIEYLKNNSITCNFKDALYANLTGRLLWLYYNLDISLNNDDIKAQDEVIKIINEINNYINLIDEFYKIYNEIINE